jgi:rod shape determining protein RodA
VLVIFFGRIGYGAARWLRVGPFLLQPSEVAKLATILALARYISREDCDLNQLKPFLLAALFPFVPFLLIARQPDLGTAMVFAALTLPMFYWAGLKGVNLTLIIIPFIMIFASFNFYAFLIIMLILLFFMIYSRRSRLLIIFVLLLNIVVGLTTPALWSHLKPYQRNRIIVFLDPESDPKGSGYQIIQSKVAIGSGGLTGKGFMQGSQTQLRFLPEQHTDFIYAVIGEEFGFRGVMLGIVLFTIFFVRGIQIAASVKNKYNGIVAIGIVTVLLFQAVINMGMTIGLFPVTGLPLPFLSYGGSAMLTNLLMVGILLNFYRNKYEY